MFLTTNYSGYNRADEQVAGGLYLILMTDAAKPIGPDNFRAIVRFARLRQMGHWMIGSVQIGSKRMAVSGAYGNDGLSSTVTADTYALGVDVPLELYSEWCYGGGHNGSGSEAPAFRKWAAQHLQALRSQ